MRSLPGAAPLVCSSHILSFAIRAALAAHHRSASSPRVFRERCCLWSYPRSCKSSDSVPCPLSPSPQASGDRSAREVHVTTGARHVTWYPHKVTDLGSRSTALHPIHASLPRLKLNKGPHTRRSSWHVMTQGQPVPGQSSSLQRCRACELLLTTQNSTLSSLRGNAASTFRHME